MIECACLYHSYDHGPTVCVTEIRCAARDHVCCECGETITCGTRYEYVRGMWDGGWDTYRTCLVCAGVRRDLMSCGWIYGQLWEDLREHFRNIDPSDDLEWLV